MIKIKRPIIILFLIVMLAGLAFPIEAKALAEWPTSVPVESVSAVVMDYDTGTIAYDKNSREKQYPASITKIMTALLAIENSKLDEKVEFSRNAVYSIEPGSSSISRDQGEILTMEETIYALMLESANECANAIAEHVAGSIDKFADMMNKRAKELGCVNTHFSNANGLHDDNHYTCAYDMALIARAAYSNPTFALIAGTKRYVIPPTNKHEEPTILNNHHGMLNYYRTNRFLYQYCVGGKTGFTSMAQGTLVTYAKKDGMTIITVTMRAPGSGNYLDTRALMDYYFSKMKSVKIDQLRRYVPNAVPESISSLTDGEEIPYELDENASAFIPVSADPGDLVVSGDSASKEADEGKIGSISFEYGSRTVGGGDIVGREMEGYPFRVRLGESQEENGGSGYIVINMGLVILIIIGILVGGVLAVIGLIRTNAAFATYMRRRVESSRDPHKNMRRIRRRRSVRRRRRP